MITTHFYPSNELLFQAQKEAKNALSVHFFPRYIEPANFLTRTCNIFHDSLAVCNCISTHLIWVVHQTALLIFRGVDFCFMYIPSKLLDSIYPINGMRQINFFSRKIEKFLGDHFFYPLNTLGYMTSNEKVPYSTQKISQFVDTIVEDLLENNKDLLNPPGDIAFEYKAQSVIGSQMNAFAIPGGKMVVFSELVKEIAREIKNGDIKQTVINFEDESQAIVNLKGVTFEDVLAALLGHEMTHIASRHSMGLLCENLLRSALLTISRFFIEQKIENTNNESLSSLESLIGHLIEQFRSRENEFEADVTGCFLANKAGFDPRGALYLQEFLLSKTSKEVQKMLEYTEFLNTHPSSNRRLRALFAGLSKFSPESLKGNVSWHINKEHFYDLTDPSPAIVAAVKIKESLDKS